MNISGNVDNRPRDNVKVICPYYSFRFRFHLNATRQRAVTACDWTITAQKNIMRHIVIFRRQNYISAKMTE